MRVPICDAVDELSRPPPASALRHAARVAKEPRDFATRFPPLMRTCDREFPAGRSAAGSPPSPSGPIMARWPVIAARLFASAGTGLPQRTAPSTGSKTFDYAVQYYRTQIAGGARGRRA